MIWMPRKDFENSQKMKKDILDKQVAEMIKRYLIALNKILANHTSFSAYLAHEKLKNLIKRLKK